MTSANGTHGIARGVPERERFVRHGALVAHRLGEPRQGLAPQEGEIVRLVGLFAQQRRRAPRACLRARNVRGIFGYRAREPIGENALRARQYRLDFPERVVEVEADRAHGAQAHGKCHGAHGTAGDTDGMNCC